MMQDDDGGLVEAIARALATADGYYPDATEKSDPAYHPLTPAGWRRWHDYRDGARAALSAIEREGFKVVPVEEINRLKAAAGGTSGHSYGNYHDGFGGSKWD